MGAEAPRCPRCRKIGLVRMERVIKGTDTLLAYNCWSCEHTWRVPEPEPSAPPKTAKRPKRRLPDA